MSGEPLVSVIALCYNHSPYVVECLEGIRKQTYKPIQLIIVDDFSKDNSVVVIRQWIAGSGLECLFIAHEKNAGVCKSINEALRYVEGDYVSIIATDDVWMENKIEDQIAVFLNSAPNVGVVYGDAYRIDSKGQMLEPATFIQETRPSGIIPRGKVFLQLLESNFISAPTALIRMSCFKKVGGYDERLFYEDYDMWLRISRHYDFAYTPHIATKYRILSTSLMRTLISNSKDKWYETRYIILNKWLDDDTLQEATRKSLKEKCLHFAYSSYELNSKNKARALWYIMKKEPSFRIFVRLCLSLMQIPFATQQKLLSSVARHIA